MANMEESPGVLDLALQEADKVAKRQKTCAAKTSGVVYKLINAVEDCLQRLSTASSSTGHNPETMEIVQNLVQQIDALHAISEVSSVTKELHGAVSKLAKAIDKAFPLDVTAAMRPVQMDPATLDRVVAEHLYHEGAFEVGDAFVAEAGVHGADAMKAPYAEMHAIIEEMRRKNLEPVLTWAERNSEALRRFERGPSAIESTDGLSLPSSFEFALHRLAFLQELERGGQGTALAYARRHFPPFVASGHLAGVQRLMGALAFRSKSEGCTDVGGDKVGGPYADLFGPGLLEEVIRAFRRQCCALLGQAQDSPLLVAVAAGSAALPTLLKLASVVAKTQPAAELAHQADELPVEVPLGREFVFHSIFACPVSREQSGPDNPPMMLPCGHCICRLSIVRIAKSATRAFKCPYCPVEATLGQCLELHLPEKRG
jgi:E3 ubiquitin-protein transferase RMND5